MHVCPRINQHFGDIDTVFFNRDVQRGFAKPVAGIGGCTSVQTLFHRFKVCIACSHQ